MGQTIRSVEERWQQHSRSSSSCDFLLRAINKYGKNNFKIEVIKTCLTEKELNEEETRLIIELNSLAPNGYNLMTGGAAPKHSTFTKEKMSKTRQGKHPSWATKASTSLESRKKRSESHLKLDGIRWTQEEREKAKDGAQSRSKRVIDNFGVEHRSISEAGRNTNCSKEAVRQVAYGHWKETKSKDGRSFSFSFINELK